MRILMTGASGFLGRPLLDRLSGRHEVVTLGRAAVGGAAGHVEADLSRAGDLDRRIAAGALPGAIDALVHLAVSRLHRGFPETAPDMFQVNVAATAALADYARRAGARYVLLGSTGTVYHPFKPRPMAEDEADRPGSYFGWSKLAGEEVARHYAPTHFDLFVPRFFVPYGPGQADRMIDGLVDRVESGKPVTLPADGEGLVSSPIYRDDAVTVLELAIEQGWSGTCNVGGTEALSLAEMARIIGEVVGREPAFERSATANASIILPDLARLSAFIDPAGFTTFREGISRTIAARDPHTKMSTRGRE